MLDHLCSQCQITMVAILALHSIYLQAIQGSWKTWRVGTILERTVSVLWIKHTYTHTNGGNFFLYCLRQSKALESVLVELNKCYLKFWGEKDHKYKFKVYIYIGNSKVGN